ncbi:MAG: two-component sensor histidine kinase [Acidimicrobiales bacterium]|nr:two-component sensor histidine kinase [Acidimicrobiales bacterium]
MTRRVLAAIVLVAALAVTGFAIPLGVVIRQLYEKDALLRLQREATAATIEVPSSYRSSTDHLELPRLKDGTQFAVYLPSGQRTVGTGPSRGDEAVDAALDGRIGYGRQGPWLVVGVPVTSGERVFAVVRAQRPIGPVDARTRKAWLAMGLLAIAVLVAAALLAVGLARRLVRPVASLSDAAARLGDGDFATRAAHSGIDEVDRAADALNATASRLGGLLERERAFSADASHQLRTPLTALHVHLAEASETADAVTQDAIDDARHVAERLSQTVEDLLGLARDVDVADDLDLASILAETERAWHGTLAAAGRALVIDQPRVPPPLRASRAALHQVLDVLLSNAERHGRGTVTVSLREITGGVAIEVADEGPGVAADHESIFTRRGEEASGHGIGLALARSLTEAEGGRLMLRPDAPTTTFAILFPTPDH